MSILTVDQGFNSLGPAPSLIKTGQYNELVVNLANCSHIQSYILVRARCVIDEAIRYGLSVKIIPPTSSKVKSYMGRMEFFNGFQYIYPYNQHQPNTFFTLKQVTSDRTEYLYEDCRRIFGLANIPNNYIDSLTDAWTELANNIYYHSGLIENSGWGYIHAQAYLTSKNIKVALSDPGVGFYGSYQRTGQLRGRNESQIIVESFNLMESSLNPNPGRGYRGIGLNLVKEFISNNGGVLYIWSGSTLVTLKQNGIFVHLTPFYTAGTVIEMEVKIV